MSAIEQGTPAMSSGLRLIIIFLIVIIIIIIIIIVTIVIVIVIIIIIMISVGDILLTINGVNVLDLPHTQVVRVAQKCEFYQR